MHTLKKEGRYLPLQNRWDSAPAVSPKRPWAGVAGYGLSLLLSGGSQGRENLGLKEQGQRSRGRSLMPCWWGVRLRTESTPYCRKDETQGFSALAVNTGVTRGMVTGCGPPHHFGGGGGLKEMKNLVLVGVA